MALSIQSVNIISRTAAAKQAGQRWVDSPEAGKSLWRGSNLSDSVSRYQSANTTRNDSIATCPPPISLRRILQPNGHGFFAIVAVELQSWQAGQGGDETELPLYRGRKRTCSTGGRRGLGWQPPPLAAFRPRTCVGISLTVPHDCLPHPVHAYPSQPSPTRSQ